MFPSRPSGIFQRWWFVSCTYLPRELLELEPETAKFGKPEKLADGRRVRVSVEVFGKGVFKVSRNHVRAILSFSLSRELGATTELPSALQPSVLLRLWESRRRRKWGGRNNQAGGGTKWNHIYVNCPQSVNYEMAWLHAKYLLTWLCELCLHCLVICAPFDIFL